MIQTETVKPELNLKTLVLQQLTMVQTRSMSKADTETATDTQIVGRASKQTRKKATKNADCYLKCSTLDSKAKKTVSYLKLPTKGNEALFIFMEDYIIRHSVQDSSQFYTVDFAGPEEWRQMSDLQRAPFVKEAMVRTRSMLKADTETATDTKIVGRASKQTRKKATKNADCYLKRSTLDSKAKKTVSPTIDSEAMFIFMEDYMIRHPVQDFLQFDLIDSAGQKEWRQMSDLQKAPFVKTAMERREKRAKPAH